MICGYETRKGKPCRRIVIYPANICWQHWVMKMQAAYNKRRLS